MATRKVIITAALIGSAHTPSMSPHLPITPKQIADEAVRAYEAGAAVVHVHVRDPETGMHSSDLNLFREVLTNVKSRCNVVINTTTSAGETREERIRVVKELKPEMASLNMGSINFGFMPLADTGTEWKLPWEKAFLNMADDIVFTNTFRTLREFSQAFDEVGTKPELEIYDVGMIHNLAYMLNKGHAKKPVYMQFVLGTLGAIDSSPRSLMTLYDTARDVIGDFTWSALAGGRREFPLCTMAMIMRGNARVGLEDNLYLDKGVLAKSNAELVEKIIRIARELSLEPATPDEARQILGLKGMDKVNY